jgi:hypothetical protein
VSLERRGHVGATVHRWTDHLYRHRPNPPAPVLGQHPQGNGHDVVLTGAAGTLLAPVAGKGVQGPLPHLTLGMVEVGDHLGQRRLVHGVVEDLQAADADLVVVGGQAPKGRRRSRAGRQQPPVGVLLAMLHREVGDEAVV